MDRKPYYKDYYLMNKETIKEQIRHNYNNNKERINKKIECECGRIIIKRMIKKHLKTNIHDKCLFIKNNNIQIENNNNNENEKKLHNGIVIFK
jgi:hypothetical protein